MNRAKLDWELRTRILQTISEALGYVGISNTIEHPGYIHVIDGANEARYLACGFDGDGKFNIDECDISGRDVSGRDMGTVISLPEREDADFIVLCIGMALRHYTLENSGGGFLSFRKGANRVETLVVQIDSPNAPRSFASPCRVARSTIPTGEELGEYEYKTVRGIYDML